MLRSFCSRSVRFVAKKDSSSKPFSHPAVNRRWSTPVKLKPKRSSHIPCVHQHRPEWKWIVRARSSDLSRLQYALEQSRKKAHLLESFPCSHDWGLYEDFSDIHLLDVFRSPTPKDHVVVAWPSSIRVRSWLVAAQNDAVRDQLFAGANH